MLEYRALLEQLRKSEDSGRRIDANNRQLQAEILANDAKLPYAKRIMTDSEQNIITLKQVTLPVYLECKPQENVANLTRILWKNANLAKMSAYLTRILQTECKKLKHE